MATNDQIRNEMKRLGAQLRLFAKAYYIDAKPLVSDDVYNTLFARLKELEEKFPFFKEPGSITDKVMDDLTMALRPVRHITPMLSLRTVTQYEDEYVLQWWQEMAELLKDLATPLQVVVQHKYDGMSVDLHYTRSPGVDGRLILIEASTRGNGQVGESVLHNIQRLKEIDKYEPDFDFHVDEVHLRCEALLPLKDFEDINAVLKQAGKEPYANARNAVAGILRSKEPSPYADRMVLRIFDVVDFLPSVSVDKFNIADPDDLYGLGGCRSVLPALAMEARSAEELLHHRCHLRADRRHLPVLTDGLVYKLWDPWHRKLLGWASSYPKWAIAHKFQPEEVVTTLEAIETQVGRTGVITPVAKLKPVVVGGVEVSSGTLSNQDIAVAKGVFIGAQVIVRRAGDVVPEIVGIVPGQETTGPLYQAPSECPSCGGQVKKINSIHYCMNKQSCPAQLQARLEHAVGKTALDIQNLGPETLATLIDKKLIDDLIGLWHIGIAVNELSTLSPLEKRNRELSNLTQAGFTEATAASLLDAIQHARLAPLDRWLTAMSISLIGPSTAAKIANSYRNWWEMISTLQDQKNAGSTWGLGPKESKNLLEFANQPDHQLMFARMAALGLNPVSDDVLTDGPLQGKRFVITGSFDGLERQAMTDALRRLGASVGSSISAKTDCVVVGESPGPDKIKKIEELKILQIDQGAFERLLAHPESFEKWAGQLTVSCHDSGVITCTF